ncbi:MAG: Gfo/Idh/MocA family protein [Acidimicrobiales bacterium]
MIQVALLGYGKVARELHQPPWRLLEAEGLASVDMVCEPSAAGCRQARIDFPDARVLECAAEDALDELDCLSVDLATPGHTHAPLVLSLLERGHDVLVEKPLCHSLGEWEAIDAVSSDRVIGICQTHRVSMPAMAARKAIDEGRMGQVTRVQVTHHARHVLNEASWVTDSRPDGVVFENVIHFVDLALYLLDAEPVTIDALKVFETGHRRIVTGIELMASGSRGCHLSIDCLQDTLIHSALMSRTMISGTGADAELTFSPPGFRLMSGVQDPISEIWGSLRRTVNMARGFASPSRRSSAHELLIRDFVGAVNDRRCARIPPPAVKATTALLEEVGQRWAASTSVDRRSAQSAAFTVWPSLRSSEDDGAARDARS